MNSIEMNAMAETSPLRFNRSYSQSPASRLVGDMVAPTITTMSPVIKYPHANSVITMEQNLPYRTSNPGEDFQKFSTKLLRNKTLLVPTRLALKRQRASFKSPNKRLEPMYSDTLQMELGNPEELSLRSDLDEDESKTLITQNTRLSFEQNRTQSISNPSGLLREDTPHTLPTDISLLYREKPLFSHPVTGHFIVQYAEEIGGPSPCSYVLPRKSCREKNAPAFSFGSRCLVEKKGGSRTGWQKQWFAHSDPYTTKVDFNREPIWPTPFHYPAKPTLGIQATKVSFPAWSIASRLHTNATIKSQDNPSPDAYDTISAFRKITAKNTQITFKTRLAGTQVSTNPSTSDIPAPNTYDERKFFSNKSSAPKHSFGRRMPTALGQDPYVNTLPSIET